MAGSVDVAVVEQILDLLKSDTYIAHANTVFIVRTSRSIIYIPRPPVLSKTPGFHGVVQPSKSE